MFVLDFLFYHANLLGKRRDTLWQDGWLGAFYVISGIVGLWLLCAILFIEKTWGAFIQGIWRYIIYMVLPLLIIVLLAIYYKCFEKRIMERMWQKTMKYNFLQFPSYFVLFVYWLLTIALVVYFSCYF